MESKNLIIAFVWIFVLISLVTLSLEGFGITFVGYILFFATAFVSTIAVEAIIPDKMQTKSEIMIEIQNIKRMLNVLKKESELR